MKHELAESFRGVRASYLISPFQTPDLIVTRFMSLTWSNAGRPITVVLGVSSGNLVVSTSMPRSKNSIHVMFYCSETPLSRLWPGDQGSLLSEALDWTCGILSGAAPKSWRPSILRMYSETPDKVQFSPRTFVDLPEWCVESFRRFVSDLRWFVVRRRSDTSKISY